MRVDTQVHVVSPDRDRYPLDPPPLDIPPWYERSPVSAEELSALMDAVGVERVVLVQAFSAYRYDNRYTADAAATSPERFACACIVDVEEDPVAASRYWVATRGARAIRLFLQLGDGGWLDGPGSDRVFDALAGMGAIAQMAVSMEQLPAVGRAASRHPEVPFLVDHCGHPDLSGGSGFPRAQALFHLSDVANVRVKLSTQVYAQGRLAGVDPREITRALVGAYGAHRVMWASDLTVHQRPYAELVAEAEAACAGLGPGERDLVLDAAAAALWWPSA